MAELGFRPAGEGYAWRGRARPRPAPAAPTGAFAALAGACTLTVIAALLLYALASGVRSPCGRAMTPSATVRAWTSA